MIRSLRRRLYMSNARSPREVCSTTIGTSGLIVLASFCVLRWNPADSSNHPAPRDRGLRGLRDRAISGSAASLEPTSAAQAGRGPHDEESQTAALAKALRWKAEQPWLPGKRPVQRRGGRLVGPRRVSKPACAFSPSPA